MPQLFKTGRTPRTFRHDIPHLSVLKSMKYLQLPALLPEVHQMASMPANLGVMLNDRLGDCTCAGLGHIEQVITADAQGQMITVPDSSILDAYMKACGFDPNQIASDGSNPTDQGGNEQDVLNWYVKTGLLQADGSRSRAISFVEIDKRLITDVMEGIQECGCVYIGFEVPQLLPEDPANALWSGLVNLGAIEGGHCVLLTGFSVHNGSPTFDVESWGMKFRMDETFFNKYVDETYAILHPWQIQKNGKTPWGLDQTTLAALEQAIRAA